MNLVDHALSGSAPKRTRDVRPTVLVAGGGGPLGSALLEHLLGGGFAHVRVLATQSFSATLQGLEPVRPDALVAPAADLAIVVFDRERHANGRDAAFVRPSPADLPALARTLHGAGVRDLLVVLPHAPATLPQALREGLANLDEQGVAALGFEHLVILRSAQAPGDGPTSSGWQRIADAVLAQLRVMTPQTQQPVRAAKVATLAVAIAKALPASPPGTRVMPPEVVWLASQQRDVEPLAQAWLDGRALPEASVRAPRM